MEKEQYLTELSRMLNKSGIKTAPFLNGELPVLLDGECVCRAGSGGDLYHREGDLYSAQALDVYDRAENAAKLVREYMTAMEQAPPLHAVSLDEQYKLLADFGGYVLAGQETTHGMKFITWSWDYDRTGVTIGHYFYDDYQAAKEDFAVRSGLVQKEALFTPEQLTAVYACIEDVVSLDSTLTYEQEKTLEKVQEKISALFPNMQEQTPQTQQQTM